MSIGARREYLGAIWERYQKASKREKTQILNEFVQVTGLNRKYVITRLKQPLERLIQPGKSGAPRQYPRESLLPFVKELWMCMEQIGSKRMKEALPVWLPFYENSELTEVLRIQLLKMSASTLERILGMIRKQLKPHGLSGTKAQWNAFRNTIPIQTRDFNIQGPGHLEGDTVHHCGTSLHGEYVHSVNSTDIFSSWTETRAVHCRSSLVILKATQDIEQSLPFDVLSMDYDNGSEFLNYDIRNYWENREKPVKYLRSRPYRKDDQCFIEQKNFTHVRQIFGYERITGRELASKMNQIYRELWCPLHNFFLPSTKLLTKMRVGAKMVKKYEKPKTPYQRLMESSDLSKEKKLALEFKYQSLNPFHLRLMLEQELKNFFSLLQERKRQDFSPAA